jgi:hypothetical protein
MYDQISKQLGIYDNKFKKRKYIYWYKLS